MNIDFKKKIKEIGPAKIAILLIAGVLLLVLSVGTSGGSTQTQDTSMPESSPETNRDYVDECEQRLISVLRNVSGVGDVKVMVTLKSSEEKVTLKDNPHTESKNKDTVETTSDEETVLIEGTDGSQSPYVVKENEPLVEGVVVVAQGGDNVAVKGEIISAIQALFNVPSHKIKVMKMEK